MSSSQTFPVQVLRGHITALEAAISVCLADPGHKPVHRLRTETRRVEALLLLLALIPGLPEHRKQAAALLRALGKLRRAAGEVRDLDVHRKMLEEFAEAEDAEAGHAPAANGAGPHKPAAKQGSAPVKSAPAKAASAHRKGPAAQLSEAAADLRKHMGRERDKAAAKLQDLLRQRQVKTAGAAQNLLGVLEPAQDFALPAPDLLRDAESVLAREGLLTPKAVPALKEDDLHAVRKAAKAARYVAEALPGDPALTEAARAFESLQEAGGQWHDALEIARAARRFFGKSHELTTAYRKQRDAKLKSYRAALTARAGTPSDPPKRRPASARKPANQRKTAA